jgi:hypothetical protein
MSENIGQIAKIRPSPVVNDVPQSFLFKLPKTNKLIGAGSVLCDQVDAALFGLLRIQSFPKKVGNCALVHCQYAKVYSSRFLVAR